MQQLDQETIGPVSPADCSTQLIEVIPVIMRWIVSEIRRRTMPGLTIPQFRAMNYLSRHPRTSLSDLAAYLGLTPPSTSKLVQKLVEQRVLMRRVAKDRRRICLSLTQRGLSALGQARAETTRILEDNLKSLSPEDMATVSVALAILDRAFSKGGNDVSIS